MPAHSSRKPARSPRRDAHRGRDSKHQPSGPAGIHLLRDRRVSTTMVESAAVGPGDLVVEFGAGTGALTTPLAATGARILAVEQNPRFVRRLQGRFDGRGCVRVIEADARTVPLPHRAFFVVANVPYGITTALVRRVLSPEATALAGADLLVEWGLAKRLTAEQPRDVETAWWQARFELRIARRVPPAAFNPAPSVQSAHLVIRRRPDLSRAAGRAVRSLLSAAYREPRRSARSLLGDHVPKRRAHRLLTSSGIDPPEAARVMAGEVSVATWVEIARALSATVA